MKNYLLKQTDIAPLAAFRFIFGITMCLASIRFLANGWVKELYVLPQFYFKYSGFEWVKPLGNIGMHAIYLALVLGFFMLALGLFYKYISPIVFILFTYTELLDKSNYLNHYYFISLVCFILIFLPAHKAYALDAIRIKHSIKKVPSWCIDVLKLQLAIVYIFAGIAKLNSDWMIEALPLKIWLPANAGMPLFGSLLAHEYTAYLFSWFGAFYDLFIVFFLLYAPTRIGAFVVVVIFHITTWLLFPIGMFPWVMIGSTLIFFSSTFHEKWLSKFFGIINESSFYTAGNNWKITLFAVFFLVQFLLPWRYLLYPGNVFWTENGYRFSWRVMLMEKAGTAFFYVSENGKELEIDNSNFLTKNQEKMMATQPDMILAYAHHLKNIYLKKGLENPKVRAEIYVTLNGRGSQLFIDSSLNLADIHSVHYPNLILKY